MAANRYLSQSSGDILEVTATAVSAGGANANQIVALDSTGHLDLTVMPTTIGPDVETVVASEALTAGDFVNLWNNAGALNARKADASAASGGKRAYGYVAAAVLISGNATVYFLGRNTSTSGQTVGARVYLSGSTPGAATSTPPNTSGYIVQALGVAISATDINVAINPEPIILA